MQELFDDWMPQSAERPHRHSVQEPPVVDSRQKSTSEDPVSTIHGLAAGDESDHGGWKRRTVLQTLDAVNALNGAPPPPPCSRARSWS